MTFEEQVKRLESELNYEKRQVEDHLKTLEETLKEFSSVRNEKEQLEIIRINLETEIESLKKESNETELKLEISTLKKELAEKNKQSKKLEEKHSNEVQDLKKQLMKTSEALQSAVLEKENLRESDRILLNTLDMMKIYVDQIEKR